jgi:hypothetical protein
MRGVGKVADDRYWSRTVVIDVRFSLYVAAILDLIIFPFLLTRAEKLVIDRSISTGAANMTVLLITALVLVLLTNTTISVGAANTKKIWDACTCMTNGGTVFAPPFYWCYSACSTISHGATGTVPP